MRWLIFILLILAGGAYTLTWVNTPPVALSFNAYDLAEWVTLHPVAENTSHPMQTALMLRLALVLLIWMLALHVRYNFNANGRGRWAGYAVLLALLAAIFPPLEILTEPQNTNYQQQAILFSAAVLGTMVALSGWFMRYTRWLINLIGVGAIVCSFAGLLAARNLLIGFSMPVIFGWGGFLFVLAVGMSMAINTLTRSSDPVSK
ncbi:MAG: hypothetical protein EA396_06100 [Anaerolineaceae bacterium]|nr:MAG: hypothetical protein EA396_06100 [Anaerolineaceae bacterium]